MNQIKIGRFIFSNSYFNKEWYRANMGRKALMLPTVFAIKAKKS